MNAKSALRFAIVADVLLGIAGIVLSSMLEGHLPLPLREWLNASEEVDLTAGDVAFGLIALLMLALMIVALVGLFFIQRWARWLYLGGLLALYILAMFLGPTVEHAVADVVADISTLVEGVILGIVFFTGVFEKSKQPLNSLDVEGRNPQQ